jgi:hypothetical protein
MAEALVVGLDEHKTKERVVEERAKKALTASPVFALRELTVQLSGEQLRISGTVSSWYHKQLAQEAVRIVATGLRVVNSVQVESP